MVGVELQEIVVWCSGGIRAVNAVRYDRGVVRCLEAGNCGNWTQGWRVKELERLGGKPIIKLVELGDERLGVDWCDENHHNVRAWGI